MPARTKIISPACITITTLRFPWPALWALPKRASKNISKENKPWHKAPKLKPRPEPPAEECVSRRDPLCRAAAAFSRRPTIFRQRPHARIFLVVVILSCLVGGFFAWRYFSSYESTDDAEVDGHLMPVSARISGYVSKVNVDDNQYRP